MDRKDTKTYRIIGAAMEVHRILGPGFLEGVYQEALAIEFTLRKIPFRREVYLPIYYKDYLLKKKYRTDFLCFEHIIVELKAICKLSGMDTAQIIHYLNATKFKKSLLLNFGAKSLEYKRFVF